MEVMEEKAPSLDQSLVPTEKLKELHKNLSKDPNFTVPLNEFEADMQDENKLKQLHENLSKRKDFTVPYDQFKTDMFQNKRNNTPSTNSGVSPVESLHSTIPYVNVNEQAPEKSQIIQSIPKPKENIEPAQQHILPQTKVENILPQQKTGQEKYFTQAQQGIGGAQISAEKKDEYPTFKENPLNFVANEYEDLLSSAGRNFQKAGIEISKAVLNDFKNPMNPGSYALASVGNQLLNKWKNTIPEDNNSVGSKIGGTIPYVGMAVASMFQPEIAPATTAAFFAMGQGEGLTHAEDIEKKTGQPIPEWKKQAYGIGYGTALSVPWGGMLKYIVPAPIKKYAINAFIKSNPELIDGVENTLKSFIDATPTGIDKLINTGKQYVSSVGKSVVGMEAMDAGKLATNKLLGEQVGINDVVNGIKESVSSGTIFESIIFPFSKSLQNANIRERREQQGTVAIGIVNGKPAEIYESGGKYYAVRPDGTVKNATQTEYNNSIIIPTDVFNKTIETGIVSPTIDRDIYSGRLTDMMNRISDKNGNIYSYTNNNGDSFFVLGKNEDGSYNAVDKNGVSGTLPNGIKIKSVNKGIAWQQVMNKYDENSESYQQKNNTVTTAIVDGEQYTVNNPEDIGVDGKAVFVKDANGNTKVVSPYKVTSPETKTAEQIEYETKLEQERQQLTTGINDPNAQITYDSTEDNIRVVRFDNGQSKIITDKGEVIANNEEEENTILDKLIYEGEFPQQQSNDQGQVINPAQEKKVVTQKIGNTPIDIIENEGYDEIVPSEKVPLEKSLPILEKKFENNPKFELQVEKVQVEEPGETKYDEPVKKTVIKSIRIVPKTAQTESIEQGTTESKEQPQTTNEISDQPSVETETNQQETADLANSEATLPAADKSIAPEDVAPIIYETTSPTFGIDPNVKKENDSKKIVRKYKGLIFKDTLTNNRYTVVGYNSGYLTLEDIETGKIKKIKDESDEWFNEFVDVTYEEQEQGEGITSKSLSTQNSTNYNITQYEDNVFNVQESGRKNAPVYKVIVGEGFDLDNVLVTKEGKPLKKNEKVPYDVLIAIQTHVERFNPESKKREIYKFLRKANDETKTPLNTEENAINKEIGQEVNLGEYPKGNGIGESARPSGSNSVVDSERSRQEKEQEIKQVASEKVLFTYLDGSEHTGDIIGEENGKLRIKAEDGLIYRLPKGKVNDVKFRVKEREKTDVEKHLENLQSIDNKNKPIHTMSRDEIIDYLEQNKNRYPQAVIDKAKNSIFSAIYLNNELIIVSDLIKDPKDVSVNWIHERVHDEINDNISKQGLNDLYDSLGEEEIRRVVPSDYWNDPKYVQADEYIAFSSEQLVIDGTLDDNIPDNAKEFIINIVENFTTLKKIQDATYDLANVELGKTQRIANEGDNDGSGIRKIPPTDNRGENEVNGSIRKNEGRNEPKTKLTISGQASENLKLRHNALEAITRISTELNIPIQVVDSSELVSDNGQLVLSDSGKTTIVSDRVKSVSETIKALVKEVASENGIREMLSNAEPNSIIGKQLAKFDELSPEELQSDKLAQIIRKAFRLTSNQFSQNDLLDIIREQRRRMEEQPKGKKAKSDQIRFKIEDQSQIIQDARKFSNFEDFVDAYNESDFRDTHSAPRFDNTPTETKLDIGGDFSLIEVANGFHNQPDDYFAPRIGARYYGYDDLEGMQSYTAINNIIRALKSGINNKKITAYRAVPKDIKINKLIDGDWVTFSKEYAIGHGESRFGEKEYKIIKQNVDPKNLWWDGNDINEWGYDTGETEKLGRSDLKKIWDEVHNETHFRIIGEKEEQLPEIITVNGVERSTRNSKGQFIHTTKEGIENFWKWFGDSKVVDKKGRPMVVYHGTDEKFNEFNLTKGKKWASKIGFWLTDDIEFSKLFGENTMKLYTNIQNPIVISQDKFNKWRENHATDNDWWNAKKQDWVSNNIDGLIVSHSIDKLGGWDVRNPSIYAAFDPSQIKSANENSGSFSSEDNDIRFRIKPDKPEEPYIEELWPDAKVNVANTGTIYAELNGIKVRIANHEPNYSAPRSRDYIEIYTEDIEGKKIDWVSKLANVWGETPEYLKYIDRLDQFYEELEEYYKPLREQQEKENKLIQNERTRKQLLANNASDEWIFETDRMAEEAGMNKSNGNKRRKARYKIWNNRTIELFGEPIEKSFFLDSENKRVKHQDDILFRIEQERENVNTEPSEAQKEAGNYKMGHIRFDGFDISIENPKGSVRSGVDKQGNEWSQEMPVDYGYFRGTVGKDKDHVDVFIGNKPESNNIYVIDQIDPNTGKFDEHKVMLGFDNQAKAKQMYLASFEPGWKGLGEITKTDKQGLKEWFEKGDQKKPFSDNEKTLFRIVPKDETFDKLKEDLGKLTSHIPGKTEATETYKELTSAFKNTVVPYLTGSGGKEAATSMTKNLAYMQRQNDIAAVTLKKAKKTFDKMSNDECIDFIDRMERGLKQPTFELQSYADALSYILKTAREDVQNLGTGKLNTFIENYFPHNWEDKKKASNIYSTIAKRPYEGKKSFLKQRTIVYTKDGIEKGLIPVSYNPVTLVLLKAREMERYVMAHKTINELKENGYVQFVKIGQPKPENYKLIDDKVSTVYSFNPETKLLELKGHYYAEENAARILNNFLSKGLMGNAAYDIYRGLGNTFSQFQLGLSAFHLGFTSFDASISQFAIGLEYLYHGELKDAMKSFAFTPIAPVTNFIQGNKLMKAWYGDENATPEMKLMAELMVEAGGRAKMDDFYKENWGEMVRQNIRNKKYIKAGLQFPMKLVELMSEPILGYIVPRQKLGVFVDMAKYDIATYPNSPIEVRRQRLQKAWASVDNRMGQLVYDNLFWNKKMKDIAMASVRSVGWNLGSFREIGGAPKQAASVLLKGVQGKRAEDTHKIAYLMSLVLMTGIASAIYQFLATGKWPEEPKDLAFPQNGNFDSQGNPERVSMPTYLKDIYHYSNDFPSGAINTLKNKLSPVNSIVAEMLSNKDFYGTKVYNEDDPALDKAKDIVSFIGKQFVPFGIRNLEKSESENAKDKILPFIGITPAPYDLNMTPAETKLNEIMQQKQPVGGRTKEKEEQRQERIKIKKEYLKTKDESIVDDAIDSGILTPAQGNDIIYDAELTPIENLSSKASAEELYSVYKIANDKEKELIAPILLDKCYNKYKTLSNEEDISEIDKIVDKISKDFPDLE